MFARKSVHKVNEYKYNMVWRAHSHAHTCRSTVVLHGFYVGFHFVLYMVFHGNELNIKMVDS